ncbi:MAG: FG-GAP repeat protein [Deltaproteobacteria bacterium]|nr:FG-GAP repeat protein [Deltaproteobacteria bacterium]
MAACDPPAGHVATSDDCNDSDAAINPSAVEVCHDGVDNDCDGVAALSCFPPSGTLPDRAELFPGVASGDYAGAVAGLGDVNGDGWDDLAVGAYGNDDEGADAGAAYLILGRADLTGRSLAGADATYTGAAAGDHAYYVAGPGDVDGDGLDDLVVGSPTARDTEGTVALLLGRTAPVDTSLRAADATIVGTRASEWVGDAIDGLGDFNGDGFADYVVGSYHDADTLDDGGAAYVVLGSATPSEGELPDVGIAFAGKGANYSTATRVAGVGDVNGDGLADVAVSSLAGMGPRLVATEACLVLGLSVPEPRPLVEADATFTGVASDGAITDIAAAGDVNGDGLGDLLIGMPFANRGAPWAGAAYLVLGSATPSSSTLGEVGAIFAGEGQGDAAGYAVSTAGDIDADGLDDLVVGAPWHENGDGTVGAIYLVRGAPVVPSGSLALARAVYRPGTGLVGNGLSAAGDANGDGYGDTLIASLNDDSGGRDAGAAFLLFGGG